MPLFIILSILNILLILSIPLLSLRVRRVPRGFTSSMVCDVLSVSSRGTGRGGCM